MNDAAPQTEFFSPDMKELGLGMCHLLSQAGGQLTFDRMAEVVGDFLQIPEAPRNIPHPRHASHTEWTYDIAWACSTLRQDGFMARNDSDNRGMCILTQPGHDLGNWASQIYAGDCPELPDWVFAFLQPLFARMKSLVEGGKRKKPPDYELCRWVRYCYLLNQPKLGVTIFNLILADHVDPALFRQAERQARILRLRLEEQGGEEKELDPRNGVAPKAPSEFRRWLEATFPPGTRIPTLVRSSDNTIQEYTDTGVRIVSSRTGRDSVVPWGAIENAVSQLEAVGQVDSRDLRGLGPRSSFICSLLARLPGAQMVPGKSAVRLANPGPLSLNLGES